MGTLLLISTCFKSIKWQSGPYHLSSTLKRKVAMFSVILPLELEALGENVGREAAENFAGTLGIIL